MSLHVLIVESLILTLALCKNSKRTEIGRSLIINSGYRCQEHNDKIPHSSKNSSHIKGLAVDLSCTNGPDRYELIALCMKSFKRVGVYAGGWVHVDVDEDKPQNVMWVG